MSNNTRPTDDFLIEALGNVGFQDRYGIGLTANAEFTDEFSQDLQDMNDLELRAKYGAEVQQNAYRLSQGQHRYRDVRKSVRSTPEALSDMAVDAASALYRGVGDLGVLAAGYTEGAFDGDDNTTGASRAAELMSAHREISAGIKQENLSLTLQEKQAFEAIEGQLDNETSQVQYEADIAAGVPEYQAAMAREGRNALNALERNLRDPALAGSIIADGVGSLVASAPLAGVGGLAAKGLTAAATRNLIAQRVAQASGIAAAAAVPEVAGVYGEAVTDVMSQDTDQLMISSIIMQGLVSEGLSPEEAKVQLAGMVAETAAVRQIIPSLALGFITNKFEAMPLGSFINIGITKGLLQIAGEGIEEAGQGISGTINRNISIEEYGNIGRGVLEGVGQEAALGALAGVGMAGVSAIPSTVRGTLNIPSNIVDALVAEGEDSGPSFAARSGRIGAAIVDEIVTTSRPIIEAATQTISTTAGRVSEAVQGYADRPDTGEVSSSVQAVLDVTKTLHEEVASGQLEDTVEIAVTQPDSDPVPESMSGIAGENRTLMENITGIVAKIGSKDFKATEADIAYAATQLNKLSGLVNQLTGKSKKQLGRVLSSKLVKKIQEESAKIDLNTTDVQDPITILNVAKTNPTNVNPETANKILEESDEQITPEDLKYVRVASKLANLINTNVGTQIEIRNNENIGLTQVDRSTRPVKSVENTSRSIQAEGYVDTAGRSLRSINDFNRDIIVGVQSPNKTIVNQKGQVVSVQKVAESMRKFGQHMQNKVQALNESLADSYTNDQGTISGRAKKFSGLRGGEVFVPANRWEKPVRYSAGNSSSVAFAQQVTADQNTLIESFNILLEEFPEVFEGLEPLVPIILNPPETASKQQETTQEQEQEPTAIDEEAATAASEEQDQEIQEEVTPSETIDEVEVSEQAEIDEETATAVDEEIEDAQEAAIEEQVIELTEEAPNIAIEPETDTIVDDNGNPVKFYHGTNAVFSEFRDGGIFLTTRKGLARDFAKGDGTGTLRLMEMNVSLANPLTEQIPNDMDPQDYWLANSLTIEQAKAEGRYDSVFLFNDKEGMVIAESNNQITILDHDVDGTLSEEQKAEIETPVQEEAQVVEPRRKVGEKFTNSFNEQDGDPIIENLDDFLTTSREDSVMNQGYLDVVESILPDFIQRMNARLQKKVKYSGISKTVAQHYKEGRDGLKKFKAAAIMDPETETYDENMLKLAIIAVVDFTAMAMGSDPNKLDDTLEKLGVTLNEIKEEDLISIMHGIPPSQLKDSLAGDLRRLWHVSENTESGVNDLEGITHGFAAEILTVLDEMEIIQLSTIDLNREGEKEAQTILVNTENIQNIQKTIKDASGPGIINTVREGLFNQARQRYSIGEKISHVARKQDRGNVFLSKLEQAALRKMQDTPHYLSKTRETLLEGIGGTALARIMGYRTDVDSITHPIIKKSVIGKNASIRQNLQEASDIRHALGDNVTPIFYPVGVTKVGRHQYQGPNPQSNKLLRMLVTSTWSTLSFETDMDSFWLGIAQAADLFKVEKKAHSDILATVQKNFTDKYGVAKDMVKALLNNEDFDGEAFADAVGEVEPQILGAIEAVASMEIARENGDAEFTTALSFELDGLTNGAANMMVNYGQGTLTREDYENFQRIGFFLGSKDMTTNRYFSQGKKDLYETVAELGDRMMQWGRKIMKPWQFEQRMAASRLASAFGNLEMHEDGSVTMTRNTAKNPMTKVNYGSGVLGVAIGLADDMLLEFYTKLQTMPDNADFDLYFYSGVQKDMERLGLNLPSNFNRDFVFSKEQVDKFRTAIRFSLGEVLTEATRDTLGTKIRELNDILVFSTNVQQSYLQKMYDKMLAERAEQLAKDEVIGRTKDGNPQIGQIPRRVFREIEDELYSLSPIFTSDEQTLAIGGFEKTLTDLRLSSNFDEKLGTGARMGRPNEIGVRAIPYSIIGTGDAMMMNLIFGSKGAPDDVLGIFDGLDVPVGKVKEYAPYVNEQVLKSWDRDVLSMAVSNFEGFLERASDADLLSEAFNDTMDKNKKSSVVATGTTDLLGQLQERLRQNRARKAVFKRLAVSVDQMGGSDVGFQRDGEEVRFDELNHRIEKELEGTTDQIEDVRTDVHESTASAVLNKARWTEQQQQIVDILKPLMGETRIVFGTLDQLNKYRQENLPDDGTVLKAKGQYDYKNDVIFMSTNKPETLLHEMVHAATYTKVLEHYNGNTNQAVIRLEALMQEFLGIESSDKKVLEAQTSILRQLAHPDAESQAAAVNEFMAYGLANTQVRKTLKDTDSKIVEITKKVVQLMRRIMGGVPTTMFDHLVFNTKVLNEPTVDEGTGGDGNGNDVGNETTPPFEEHLDYWISNWKEYLASLDPKLRDGQLNKSIKDIRNSQKVIHGFRQVGFLANRKDQSTFKAIYGIMLSSMKLDANARIALTRVFQHVVDNMTPEMFSGIEANQEYSAVLNSFGGYKQGDVSDAIAVMFGLSQTSAKFRAVLDQIPAPEGQTAVQGSLNQFFTNASSFTMRKLTGSLEQAGEFPSDVLSIISKTIIEHDKEKEYRLLHVVNNTLNKADKYLSGMLQSTALKMRQVDTDMKESTRSNTIKYLTSAVTFATNLLDKPGSDLTAQAVKDVTHMGLPILSIIPIRELVAEFVGSDSTNSKVIAMFDKVNAAIAGLRQAYREDLPSILERQFNEAPNEEQWSSMFNTLAKTDFTSIVDLNRMQFSMQLLEEGARRKAAIQKVEQQLQQKLLPYIFNDAKEKASQLADFMNGKGAGKLLIRNAYAIAFNLDGNFDKSLVPMIDRLVTLYAIDSMDSDVREETVQLWQNEPAALTGLISYIQGLNEAEESKATTEAARLNGYKGYIPNEGTNNIHITIALDEEQKLMERKGYVKMNEYTGEIGSLFPRSYYVSNVRRQGSYSQGVMQNVAHTYRGVDINTGLTVTGETAGYISGDGTVENFINDLNDPSFILENQGETLIPVFAGDGTVQGFERTISPEMMDIHYRRDENLGVMLGAWAGRQVEESLADQYNRELIDSLKDIWIQRKRGTDDLFINLKDTSDPIYKESFKLIPQATKLYIDSKFGSDGFMVRKDMVNLSVGYREASLADMWSGKTRLPDAVQAAVRIVTETVLKRKAMRWLVQAEEILQGTVSTAKDIIVVRSLVVPLANTQANIIQLATNGVSTKQIIRGYRSKLAEIEEHQKNVTKRIELKAQIELALPNSNQRKRLEEKVQVIEDLTAQMSIAPMIEAGAYKQLSEGITNLDVDISKGQIGDYMESIADKLPEKVADIAKLGLVSKSTKLYKVANRATQYGDFLAKSIYYDHLISQGLSKEQALIQMNEEFVNFTLLPGRTRSALESAGLTWFMAFKIRIAKIAMKQIRQNPFRALAINSITDVGSPVQDNVFTVIYEDRLDYATGYEMLFDAPELNPWVNLLSNLD